MLALLPFLPDFPQRDRNRIWEDWEVGLQVFCKVTLKYHTLLFCYWISIFELRSQ
jgi:hypothetical protein